MIKFLDPKVSVTLGNKWVNDNNCESHSAFLYNIFNKLGLLVMLIVVLISLNVKVV